MLILGKKYKFTKLEFQRLNKICGDITTISYKDEKADRKKAYNFYFTLICKI